MTTPALPAIGFIGLGIMGRPMALNLLKAGYPVVTFSRDPAKAADLLRAGVQSAPTAADLARKVEFVFLCLPDTPDVETVLFGDNGIAAGLRPGAIVVDCSTISPAATRGFAARLKEQGVDLIDCPVSGGAKGAEAGTLSGMLGGEAEAVAKALPLLQVIGKKFIHAGPSGAGQVVKACNQLVIASTLLGVSEAVVLCRQFGIDPETMRTALTGGAADSFVLQNHAKRLIAGTLAPGFRARLMLKDLKLAAELAEATGCSCPAGELAMRQFERLCASGRGDLDSAAVGLIVEESATAPADRSPPRPATA